MVVYGVYRFGGQWEDSWEHVNKELYQNKEDAEKWLISNGYIPRESFDGKSTIYNKDHGMWDEWEGAYIQEFEIDYSPQIPYEIGC